MKQNNKLKLFSVATVLVGIVPVMFSGARTAYVMLPALAIVWILLNYPCIPSLTFRIPNIYLGCIDEAPKSKGKNQDGYLLLH